MIKVRIQHFYISKNLYLHNFETLKIQQINPFVEKMLASSIQR